MKMSCYEEGFRLNDVASQCSMKSKARIDSLFEDSRSICSSTYADWYGSVYGQPMNPDEVGSDDQKRANGAVQARIEAMFASVEAETGKKGECAAAILPVKYLGAAPVGGRIASVRGLQEPLRQLLERTNNPLSAELEVSRRGLTFRTSELIEKTNPFRRIAVWSALRLRSRPFPPESSPSELQHAFIPLVGDDQSPGDQKHAELYRTMRGLTTEVTRYPPIFAVVMRRPGAARVLECHAFACKTEEDAIAAAATLYRALLADLDSNRRRPRQTNGLGCVSLASVASSVVEYTSVISRNTYNNHPPRQLAQHPVRPPRIKKNSVSGSTTDGGSAKSVASKPLRRKKISEIRPEDVAEARKRKIQLEESRVALKELKDDKSVLSNQGSNRPRGNKNSRSRNEEINNFRNKMYSGNEVKVMGNTSDENTIQSRKMNNYEKIPKKEKLFDLERNYSFVAKNGSIVGEVVNIPEAQLFEKNQSSYDLNRNARKGEMTSNQVNALYTTKPEISSYGGPKENGCRSRENSIYERELRSKLNSREQLYEDHFRDADKIYSIGQDDGVSLQRRKNSLVKISNDNISFNKCNIEHPNYTNKMEKLTERGQKNSQSQEINPYGSERLQRMSRMEEFTKRQQQIPLNPKISVDLNYQKINKKRDRAGSEPPLSRTESAAKIVNEIKLKRSQSDVDVERGDLLTRVELPRRGSFLKQGTTRLPNSVHGGTPLGFTELFDEFRNQEGLTSVDDILDAIIDPEGMSFNELKPLYKEFLLKLASTLTQDELYQRSANIMRRRRRPQRRRSTRKSCLLGRAIKRSVSKFKSGPTEFTSVIFPARKFNESFDSSSSGEARNTRNRVLASRLSRRKSSWKRSKGLTTSEDSDTGKRLARSAGANRSSSGYVSCSECSYDSESCTCVSADKCYCSLPRRSPSQGTGNHHATVCGCDTDSCSESNKCYCARRPSTNHQPTILEQLRQRGIVPSEGSLSRGGSPERVKTSKPVRSYGSSASLEFHKMRPSPARSSSDNLALDYDLFSPGRKSQHSSSSEKVLVVSARDPNGRLVYVGGAERNKKAFSTTASRTGAHHEALSIKKSAEIAAVFGPASIRNCRRSSSISSMKSSVSLEAGLGYLP